MASLSVEQVEDFRIDIGDENHAFGDGELNRFYSRANGNYDKAVVLAIEALLASAAKLNDYTANASSEDEGQIFQNLKELLEIKRAAYKSSKSPMRLVRLKSGQYVKRDKPYGFD